MPTDPVVSARLEQLEAAATRARRLATLSFVGMAILLGAGAAMFWLTGKRGLPGTVASTVEADSLIVDPDKLAPLALWLVEAVTNAQKHAFAGRGGALVVRFRVQGETSVLEVEDDGPGPSAIAIQAGVGRTLMGAFAKQLRGEVEILAAQPRGTIARMVFATPEVSRPADPRDLEPSDAVVKPGTLTRRPR